MAEGKARITRMPLEWTRVGREERPGEKGKNGLARLTVACGWADADDWLA